jgi:trk system potassium uptake protein TrkH
MNFPVILNIIGSVVSIMGLFMATTIPVAAMLGGRDLGVISMSVGVTLAFGLIAYASTHKHKRASLKSRDVFFTVTFSWVAISAFGAIPYLLTGTFTSVVDAFFEAVAGFTTTGATVLTEIEALSPGLLYWRSLTQWVGGMGIILFALAVLPYIGSGALQLFKAEAPEITVDKLRPRIIDTAKILWYIYASLTLICGLLYYMGGMSAYDAVCHAFTTLATGGFSTKNASIAHYQSAYIEWVCTIFMFLAGVNYTLYFFVFRGRFDRLIQNSEFKFYLGVTLLGVALISVYEYHTYGNVADTVRYAAFQVTSIMTTTGYASADYEYWSVFSQMLLGVLMFFGGMIGSTAGGMKQVRVMLMFKQGYRELYQLLHPRAITSLKLDGKSVTAGVLSGIWGFLFIFLLTSVFSTLVLTGTGIDLVTASSSVISAMSNVGPALGEAGPTENYSAMPALAKIMLSLCMLIGRLEVYTVIILFLPAFWKK